ncbi:hypothetical protein AJ79_02417 [Helicocarpus griseus UAMH5409]|uniref:Protein kinase domain-containing protein n=1 Tax=Helicocarpus griseus UAMH5409 TaxID=1447875 RepID=A0A2B7Y316_9EURO|nr:hypothetical protein AJ79_02417 [Helicocarpus griseus UAMH5409]
MNIHRGKMGKTSGRLVRLVLIEFVRDLTMKDASDPKATFSKDDRQRIIKGLVDFDSELYIHDIQHCDLHPRNVIIITTKAEYSTKQGVSSHVGDSTLGSTKKTNDKESNDTRRKIKVASVTIIDFGSTEFSRIPMFPAAAPEYLANFFPPECISHLLR